MVQERIRPERANLSNFISGYFPDFSMPVFIRTVQNYIYNKKDLDT